MSGRDFDAERGLLLSRLMFGWLADAAIQTPYPMFTLSGEEYVERMSDLADAEPPASASPERPR